MKFHIIMACHNRKVLTKRCVESASFAGDMAGAETSFTIFDDGSSDGTADAVGSLPVPVQVISGDGSAFWANGMALAEKQLLNRSDVAEQDYVTWLNDDVVLDSSAFSRMKRILVEHPGCVLVGAMRDPESGNTTYSGMVRAGFHPLRFEMVQPAEVPRSVQAFNGNFVVVPVAVARRLGGIDGTFAHAMADIDYGLRCFDQGIPVFLAPGTYGTCPRNPPSERNTIGQAWRAFTGVKGGGNYRSLRHFLVKHHGNAWPLYLLLTYLWWWVRRILGIVLRRYKRPGRAES